MLGDFDFACLCRPLGLWFNKSFVTKSHIPLLHRNEQNNDQLVDILAKTCVIQNEIAPGECSWIVPPHTPGNRGVSI